MRRDLPRFVVGLVVIAGLAPRAQARITFDLDYTYDSRGFFNPSTVNGQAARVALAAAADVFSDRFLDHLTAIDEGGVNDWTPSFNSPASTGILSITGPFDVPANTIKVFAGGYDLPSGTLGLGGPGGVADGEGTQAFVDAVVARGQAGALGDPSTQTDFGPWGGSIAFDTPTNWNFNVAAGPNSNSQSDFYSVALHEMAHLVGFGTADSFVNLGGDGTFTGPKAVARHGGPVPLSANGDHLGNVSSTVDGTSAQQVAMSTSLITGTRKRLTLLDWAVLDDLGWGLARPGDADASGGVDFADLLTLARNYNMAGKTWSEGDFDYDGSVSFSDLLALAKNYNTTGPLAASIEATADVAFAAD